ncbi:uncharacterized protein V1518DRAFT_417196 [Limtongia smithiae]|uniref:uncharacterized protein n=1 Tax=Limtongia smithiae TaxID=1125753 RepID=UPI0034CFC9E4
MTFRIGPFLKRYYSSSFQKFTSGRAGLAKVSRSKRKMAVPAGLHSISLDQTEAKIRELLVDACTEMDASRPKGQEKLVLRFTGGWVRDKLLGFSSHDLDVSINCMTGYDFAQQLLQFTNSQGSRYATAMKGMFKIEMNPEKSKHLETTTTKLYDIDVDLVNLRSEEYTESSRIPTMKFGTPTDDAYRRDATINALFFNLQTQQVEDFTQRGLEDLGNKVIRTPLDPLRTFQDDPLRVLRLLRFASRFNFTIAESTMAAMKMDVIRTALGDKISRERIGVELDKMLIGPDPLRSLMLIEEAELYDPIFQPLPHVMPKDATCIESPLSAVVPVLGALLSSETVPVLTRTDLDDPAYMRLVYLFATIYPWENQIEANGNSKTPIAASVVKRSLKLSSAIGQATSEICINCAEIAQVADKSELTRQEVGLLIRKCGVYWRLAFFCSLAKDIVRIQSASSQLLTEEVAAKISSYVHLTKFVDDSGLAEAYNLRPILDGNKLVTVLNLPKGPWMTGTTQRVIEWQLENPDKTAIDCEEYLLSVKDSIVATAAVVPAKRTKK